MNFENNFNNSLERKAESEAFDYDIKAGESNEEFMSRLMKYMNDSVSQNKLVESESEVVGGRKIELKKNLRARVTFNFLKNSFNNPVFQDEIGKAMSVIIEQEKKQKKEFLDEDKNEKVFSEFTDLAGYSTRKRNESEDVNDNIDYYASTNQTREFFQENRKGGTKDNIPYAMSLFNVCINDPSRVKEYFAAKLNGKRICLLGGGNSIQDLIESEEIKPKKIVNIDPYIKSDSIDGKKEKNYKSIPLKADDFELLDKLKKDDIDKFDEIWASYSVPFYNKGAEEISNLFNNIKGLLAENGNCRITPVSTQDYGSVQSFIKEVEKIKDLKEFNLHLVNNTLIIHKIEKGNNEDSEIGKIKEEQKIKDDEELLKIRDSLKF